MAFEILMIGATGLIGRLAAEGLAADGYDLHLLVRRSTGTGAGETVAPARDWPATVGRLGGDVAVCAIGTTMRAAGSQAAFRAVDYDIAVEFARAARAAGIRHMIAVSSVGADPGSRNFYLRTKGEMESALEALAFDRLDIVRPGLLRGERGGERRAGERLGRWLSPLANLILRGSLDRYAAIDAGIVAAAIAKLVAADAPGCFVHHNRDMRRLVGA